MAVFRRSRPAPKVKGGYQAFRKYVRADFQRRCAYCLMAEIMAGQYESFEIDHHRPVRWFPAAKDDFYNLYWSCHPCNHKKSHRWPTDENRAAGKHIVDFCRDDFTAHFQQLPDGRWQPLSAAAEYTCDLLRLNRNDLVELRRGLLYLEACGASPFPPLIC